MALRSFGDFKLPLYSYLTIPSIFIFDLNEFSVRLPNVIFGTLSIVATYLLAHELSKKREIAIWSALLMAISPWSISLSRGAFEANLSTFFIPFGVWCLLKARRDAKYMIISAFIFGLNLFTYHSARVFTVLFLPALALFIFRGSTLKKEFREYLIPVLMFMMFFLLMTYSMFLGAGKRGQDVLIFNPTDKWSYVSERRYEAVLEGVPDQISRIFSNKLVYSLDKIVKSYLSYLSPNFLFITGAGEWTYGMIAGRGVLYLFEIIPLLIAIAYFVRNKEPKFLKIIFVWILVSPIAVALSKNVGYAANRIAVMMPAIQILTASGIVLLIDRLSEKFKLIHKSFYKLVIFIILLTSLAFFMEDYFFHAPFKQGESMHYGIRETMNYIKESERNYDKVVISRSISVPNIWVEFYLKIDPKIVQSLSRDWLNYEHEGFLYLDQQESYRLGKFEFRSIDWQKLRENKDVLVVARPDEYKESIKSKKIVYYQDGKPAYYIVDTSDI